MVGPNPVCRLSCCPEHAGYLVHLCHLLRHVSVLALIKRLSFSYSVHLSAVCSAVAEMRGSSQHH